MVKVKLYVQLPPATAPLLKLAGLLGKVPCEPLTLCAPLTWVQMT